MDPKKANLVADIAHAMVTNKATMPVTILVEILNYNQFTTQSGELYGGGRGSYRLVKCLYDYFNEIGCTQTAEEIAEAFVDAQGNYAYE